MRALSSAEIEKVNGGLMEVVQEYDANCGAWVTPAVSWGVDFAAGVATSAVTANPYIGAAVGASFSTTGLSGNIGSAVANAFCTDYTVQFNNVETGQLGSGFYGSYGN